MSDLAIAFEQICIAQKSKAWLTFDNLIFQCMEDFKLDWVQWQLMYADWYEAFADSVEVAA